MEGRCDAVLPSGIPHQIHVSVGEYGGTGRPADPAPLLDAREPTHIRHDGCGDGELGVRRWRGRGLLYDDVDAKCSSFTTLSDPEK